MQVTNDLSARFLGLSESVLANSLAGKAGRCGVPEKGNRRRRLALSPGGVFFPGPSTNVAIHQGRERKWQDPGRCPRRVRFTVEVFVVAAFFAMELITILNRCHHFPGFVLPSCPLRSGQKDNRDRGAAPQGIDSCLRKGLIPAGARLR